MSACRSCNHRKGGKALEEFRIPLRRQPFEPKANSYYLFAQYLDVQRDWQKFMRYRRGHIWLQDHGDPVWYRNIKLRELKGE